MFAIFATINIKPGLADEFAQAGLADAQGSVRDEPGCFRFDILRDTENPNRFYLYAGMSHLGLESSARPRGRATGSPIMTNLRVKRNRSPEIHGRIPSAMPPGRSLEAFDGLRCKGCPQLTHDWLRT